MHSGSLTWEKTDNAKHFLLTFECAFSAKTSKTQSTDDTRAHTLFEY